MFFPHIAWIHDQNGKNVRIFLKNFFGIAEVNTLWMFYMQKLIQKIALFLIQQSKVTASLSPENWAFI